MLIQIKGVLDQEQLAVAHQLIAAGRFTDGSSSAGMAARRVKHNDELQLPQKQLGELNNLVMGNLVKNPLYRSAAMPLKVAAPYYARYKPGMTYGNHVDDPIMGQGAELYRSDLFDAIPPQRFDIIVSNPPYVDAEDMAALGDEYRHEPEIGLAAGEDGLALVGRMLQAAPDYLNDDGVLFIEVGNSQAAMQHKYDFLPMAWIDFEFGGAGVCCIQASDLQQHRGAIAAIAAGAGEAIRA